MSRPSLARRLCAPPLAGCALTWPAKIASDVLDYALDFCAWDTDGADAPCSLLVATKNVTALWWQLDGALAVIALAGGCSSMAEIDVTVTFYSGRRHTQRVYLPITTYGTLKGAPELCPPIVWRAPNSACVPPDALSAADTVLTLPDGSPLTA